MTPREARAEVEGRGFRLALRPGGLRLTGASEPPPDVLALIREHRDGLLALLEEDARLYAAHKESLAAGRVVPFPPHLLCYVHPSIRHLVNVADVPGKIGIGSRDGLINSPQS